MYFFFSHWSGSREVACDAPGDGTGRFDGEQGTGSISFTRACSKAKLRPQRVVMDLKD